MRYETVIGFLAWLSLVLAQVDQVRNSVGILGQNMGVRNQSGPLLALGNVLGVKESSNVRNDNKNNNNAINLIGNLPSVQINGSVINNVNVSGLGEGLIGSGISSGIGILGNLLGGVSGNVKVNASGSSQVGVNGSGGGLLAALFVGNGSGIIQGGGAIQGGGGALGGGLLAGGALVVGNGSGIIQGGGAIQGGGGALGGGLLAGGALVVGNGSGIIQGGGAIQGGGGALGGGIIGGGGVIQGDGVLVVKPGETTKKPIIDLGNVLDKNRIIKVLTTPLIPAKPILDSVLQSLYKDKKPSEAQISSQLGIFYDLLQGGLSQMVGLPDRSKPASDKFSFALLDSEFEDNPEECKSEKYCYGMGDPHYRTFDGHPFAINKTCPYLLATDLCPGHFSCNYIIVVDHAHKYSDNDGVYMSTIFIYFNNQFFTLSTDLKVFDKVVTLPYKGDRIKAYKEGIYIVLETSLFTLHFDGIQFLKFRQCGIKVCGICGNNNDDIKDDEFNKDNYLVKNEKCN